MNQPFISPSIRWWVYAANAAIALLVLTIPFGGIPRSALAFMSLAPMSATVAQVAVMAKSSDAWWRGVLMGNGIVVICFFVLRFV